ncbi:Yos1-like protein [Colletotrichum zoysiae]|uniref:Yos1-like protein n=1 Tax=Colletotrichum zoysiae TaxID=1216348 RepID=A0AAD9HKP6_9PEZI|nr:Yos1-like protein [Colletotrichum zoysiae]
MFIIGNFLYIAVLLINAIAILSEDRFLARSTGPSPPPPFARLLIPRIYDLEAHGGPAACFNLSPSSYDPSFGASADASVKAKIINLIASVRTLMRMPLILINAMIILYELILG